MKLLDKLERKFGRWAVPNVTLAVIVGQVLVYTVTLTRQQLPAIELIPARVLAGEYWRLVTFIFTPPEVNLLFVIFAWQLFYLMGTTLEHTWGTFRYNLFLLSGWAATVAVSFLVPEQPASVAFLGSSVFLAFAWLYPEFEILILFILPVKAKWLALLTWISYGYTLMVGTLLEQMLMFASLANFLLFFGTDIYWRARRGRRRMIEQAHRIQNRYQPPAARHRCRICGITEKSHPNEDFRYCSQCTGTQCYCSAHLRDHAHLLDEEPAGESEGTKAT